MINRKTGRKTSILFSVILLAGLTAGIALTTTLIGVAGSFIAGGGAVCSIDAVAGDGCLGVIGTDDIDGQTADEVQNNIYGEAVFRDDARSRMQTEITSFSNQSYGVSMGQAKLKALKALNEGESFSEAYSRIQEEVNDYYSAYQMSVLEDRNTEALQLNKTLNTVERTDGLTYGDVFTVHTGADSEANYDLSTREWIKTPVQLRNGTEIDSYNLELYYDSGDGDTAIARVYGDNLSSTDTEVSCSYTSCSYNDDGVKKIVVQSTDGSTTVTAKNKPYAEAWKSINNHRERAIANVEQVADEIYNQYEPGDLDALDVLSPIELLQTGATNYEDTGYYSYASTMYEFMGMSTDRAYAFNVTWENPNETSKTAVGQLFTTREADIEKGVQYSVDSNESVVFVHEPLDSDKAERTDITGNYTVNEMIDKQSGEEINSTSMQETSFATEDTSNLQSQLEDLRELQEDINDRGVFGGAIDDLASWFTDVLGLPSISSEAFGIALGGVVLVIMALI